MLKVLETLLPKIANELTPNGGSSLRDAIDRIDRTVRILDMRNKIMMEFSGKAWFEADVEGRCTYVCRNWTELTGLGLAEAAGNGWILGIHPDDRVLVFDEWDRAVDQDRDFVMSYRYIDRKNKSTAVRTHAYPYKINSKTAGFIGIVTPIEPPSSVE